MNMLPEYITKLSIVLTAQYLLYIVFLRKITFYRWVRIFFISSAILSFILPFINVEWFYTASPAKTNDLLNVMPAVSDISFIKTKRVPGFNWSQVISGIMILGSIIMVGRLLIQFIALVRIKRNAVMIKREAGIAFYELQRDVPSFSFGNMVFINKTFNKAGKSDYIIAHEKIHVKEMHTADILLMELLCVVNWYNPFVWLMRKAVRENLEFIADGAVINEGFNCKAYQYAMLQSASGVVLPIASSFSMPNIKKRIIMMNSIPSSKMQLLKFAVALPALVFILVIFRGNEAIAQETGQEGTSLTAKSGVYIEGGRPDGKQLIIVDGMVQSPGFNIDYIKPNDISSISVLKGEAAIKKYGKRGANGILEITTNLPLYLIDGKIQMKTSSIDQLIRSEDIRSVNVLKGPAATSKYGESGKNGVVEIIKKLN